eukprot:1159577-Pelagomonas_calceolata.AAC.5
MPTTQRAMSDILYSFSQSSSYSMDSLAYISCEAVCEQLQPACSSAPAHVNHSHSSQANANYFHISCSSNSMRPLAHGGCEAVCRQPQQPAPSFPAHVKHSHFSRSPHSMHSLAHSGCEAVCGQPQQRAQARQRLCHLLRACQQQGRAVRNQEHGIQTAPASKAACQ